MDLDQEVDLLFKTDEGGAFYLGFFGCAAGEQPCLKPVVESFERLVDPAEIERQSTPREIGRLLGDAYVQSERNRGHVKTSSRRFQQLVRKLDEDVKERSETLSSICKRRGQSGEPLIAILNQVLMDLDYPRESTGSFEDRIQSRFGDCKLDEYPQSFVIRTEYSAAMCAMLDGRVVRIAPQFRTKPMSRRKAGFLLRDKEVKDKKAGEWLGKCLADGDYAFEKKGGMIVLDVREFPLKFRDEVKP